MSSSNKEYAPIPLIDKALILPHDEFMADKTHTHAHADRHALKVRIRKIAGQLRAIETMLDDERDCPEVLTQVVSVRKGMKSFAEKLISEHLHHCIDGAKKNGDGKKKLKELLDVLERYVE